MKTTIEEIKGVACTMLWYEKGIAPQWSDYYTISSDESGKKWDFAPLPALPRNPTAKDVYLLHLYAAHGLNVQGEHYNYTIQKYNEIEESILAPVKMLELLLCNENPRIKITHATTKNGDRVDVAIIDRGV